MDGQDWSPTVVRGKADASKPVVKQFSSEVRAARAVEKVEVARIRYLSIDSVKALQEYRMTNKLTQVQLDQSCNFPKATVNAIEARRLTPTPQQLSALKRRVPGITLE